MAMKPTSAVHPARTARLLWVILRASHWIQIGLTVALLLVAVPQLLGYCRQTDIMDKQAEISAAANRLSINGLRAWVSSSKPVIFSDLTQDEKGILHLSLQYDLKNTGHTPARLPKMRSISLGETL